MKYKSYARFYQIYALLFVFTWPWLIVTVGAMFGYEDQMETKWTGYLSFVYAIFILLFFFRKGWMDKLRSKFPLINLYAIRTMLGGLVLFGLTVTIETVLRGAIDDRLADNLFRIFGLTGIGLISIAFLGTLSQSFIDSIYELLNFKNEETKVKDERPDDG